MARVKSKSHTHKYYYGWLGKTRVWCCALPDCTHYLPQAMEKQIEMKYTICWSCGEQFQFHPKALGMDQPQCLTCMTGIAPEDTDFLPGSKMHQFLEELARKKKEENQKEG